MISLDENTTPPTIRSFGIAARRRPPGSRNARSGTGGCLAESPTSYHQGMPFCANTTAVSSPSRGWTLVARLGRPVAFNVQMTASCGPSVAGSSDARHPGLEFGISDTQRQPVGLHRIEVRAPHHAGDIMPCQREPHRKVAADGARTENANPHGWIVLPRGDRERQFPQACAVAQPVMWFASLAWRNRMDQSPPLRHIAGTIITTRGRR